MLAGTISSFATGLHQGLATCQQKCLRDSSNCAIQAGMIIAVVNSKGGVGKSTLAGNLAGWLSAQGHRVILVDCDLQQSSSEWIREADPKIQVVQLSSADEVLDELAAMRADADFVIADGPGSQTETNRALLLVADRAFVPAKASMFEARALDRNTNFIRQAQSIRGGEPSATAILSMVGRGYRLTRDMRAAAIALNLPLAETAITLRQAYADAPGQAKYVWSMPTARDAAEEIDQLFRELLPTAVRGSVLRFVRRSDRESKFVNEA